MKKILIAGVVLAAVLAATVIVLLGSRPSLPPLPPGNSYADLVRAGRVLTTSGTRDSSSLSTEELRALVTANQAVLAEARTSLGRECRVPLEFGVDQLTNHVSEVASFKSLVRGFVAEGNLAVREHRPGDAARAYLDSYRVGRKCCEGGLVIDLLVGIACQSMALRGLEQTLPDLPAADCQESLSQLEAFPVPSFDTILAQERLWARHSFGIRGQLVLLMNRASQDRNQQALRKKADTHLAAIASVRSSLSSRLSELGSAPSTTNAIR